MTSVYRDGWGVAVSPVWNEDERVSDIDVEVVQLAPVAEVFTAGAICSRGESGTLYPMSNFRPLEEIPYGDTHDLRDRWFPTRAEADEHAFNTLRRWENPAPWESFVQL
jgi:hypothetical protein